MATQTDIRQAQREVRSAPRKGDPSGSGAERPTQPVYMPIDQRIIDWLRDGIQETAVASPTKTNSESLWFREGQRSIIAMLQRRHDNQVESDRSPTS
jgi:hypothetical protein